MEKLSFYVRNGNAYPQIKEDYIQYDPVNGIGDWPVVGTCALGGVAVQLFGKTYADLEGPEQQELSTRLREYFSILPETMALHPVEKEQQDIFVVVASLNDSYDWSRTAIADWLENEGY